MHIIEVGKPYPLSCPSPGKDFALIKTLEGGSFELLMYLNKPSFNERLAAKNGEFTYAVFIDKYIPFFCVEFEHFSFDASLNFHKVSVDHMQSWLSEDANAVTLILIDSSDNTVKAIRLIGVEPAAMKELKHACSEQIGWYIGAAHVDRAITEITNGGMVSWGLRATNLSI